MLIHDNPEFDAVRAAQSERHGLAIAYIKKTGGGGGRSTPTKSPAPCCPSRAGYYQLAEMPEEFAGALGAGVTHRLIAPPDALTLLSQIQAFVESLLSGTQSVRAASLYALYAGGSLRMRREMFVLDQKPGEAPFSHGLWQPETLPRFLKLRLDCGDSPAPHGLGLSGGVLFLLAPQHRDDGHALLATLAHTPGAQDLSAPKMPAMMN